MFGWSFAQELRNVFDSLDLVKNTIEECTLFIFHINFGLGKKDY